MKGIFQRLEKYKYTVLILLLGVGLLLFPTAKEVPQSAVQEEPLPELETQLEALLCQVEGAGRVDVLLTYAEGPAHTYQVDETRTTDEHGSEQALETVLVSTDAGESPIPVRTRYPVCQGAVILCEGADRPSVRLDMVNAVSDLTGLGSDKISVIKMSTN